MDEAWVWEYTIEIYNGIKRTTEICSGYVIGKDIVEAVSNLYTYYGEEMTDIKKLKGLTEGYVIQTLPKDDF